MRPLSLLKRCELWGRALLEALLSFVLTPKAMTSPLDFSAQSPCTPPLRVLVVRLDARVGNLVLLTPFLHSLKQSLPGAHVTLLHHAGTESLLKEAPHIDAHLYFHKRFLSALRLLLRLRRLRFDIAFEAGAVDTSSLTHSLMTRLSGARLLIGPQKVRRLYHIAVPRLGTQSAPVHEIDERLNLLSPFTHAVKERALCLFTPLQLQSMAQKAQTFIAQSCPHGAARTAVLIVGTRLLERRPSAALWQHIITTLHRRGLHVTLIYGPSERAWAQTIAQSALSAACTSLPPTAVSTADVTANATPEEPGTAPTEAAPRLSVTLAPDSTLFELAALSREAALVISGDTGPAHIAAAAGARLIVLFLTTSPARYGHQNPAQKQSWIDLNHTPEAQHPPLVQQALRLFPFSLGSES